MVISPVLRDVIRDASLIIQVIMRPAALARATVARENEVKAIFSSVKTMDYVIMLECTSHGGGTLHPRGPAEAYS
jgi:hypothetical protein